MLNAALLTRPWSSHRPKIEGYEPQIAGKVQKVSTFRRRSWRASVLVDGCEIYTSHHDTKSAAERKCAAMLDSYTSVHYRNV